MKKKIFKRLKNGKAIQAFYITPDNKGYTIHLEYKHNLFHLRSYYFEGNDVLDEDNYKDESSTNYSDFDEFIRALENKFPGIEIKLR